MAGFNPVEAVDDIRIGIHRLPKEKRYRLIEVFEKAQQMGFTSLAASSQKTRDGLLSFMFINAAEDKVCSLKFPESYDFKDHDIQIKVGGVFADFPKRMTVTQFLGHG